MTDHDPLCSYSSPEQDRDPNEYCACRLIARVRADERRSVEDFFAAVAVPNIMAEVRERIAQALLEKLVTYHYSEPDECGHRSLVLHGPDEIRKDAARIARGEQP